MSGRLALFTLALLCAAGSCDPPDFSGKAGFRCYGNSTCDGDLLCISWKRDGQGQSACVDPKDLVVKGIQTPRVLGHLSPLASCPAVHCPPPVCPELAGSACAPCGRRVQ